MTTEPYVPNEQEIIEGSVASEAEARRGIAKIKADALREFVSAAQDLINCSGDTRWVARALARADLIEGEHR